jgi:hypothetical protein
MPSNIPIAEIKISLSFVAMLNLLSKSLFLQAVNRRSENITLAYTRSSPRLLPRTRGVSVFAKIYFIFSKILDVAYIQNVSCLVNNFILAWAAAFPFPENQAG